MPRLRNSAALLVPLFLVAMVPSFHPTAALALDYNKCVIVMFERDVMTLPEGLLHCSLDSASISLPTLESILTGNGASIVASLVPNFELADTLGVTRLGIPYRATDWSRAYLIEVPTAEYVDSLIAALQGATGVVYAEPAAVPVYADELPYAFPSPCMDDPVFAVGDQWQYQNLGIDAGGTIAAGTPDADIDLVEAWESTRGDTMTVAVLDDGVWREHPDLAGKVHGNSILLNPEEEYHGTLVAGLIGAWSNNSIDICGVNPNANIYDGPVYRLSDNKFYPREVANAVNSMRIAQIPIANMSFSVSTSTTFEQALRNAYNSGILLVSSHTTDNRPPGVNYPARYGRPVLAVGYTDHNDQVPASQLELVG